jgi:predicted RNase H-like HicB family nuclease/uncharacterized damage-inducible protein DinB
MKTYSLVLESGPRRKKTYVHVLDLPGCMARGDTTEEALDNAPGAIRDYLHFLKRHGEKVDPDAPFEVEVAQHLMEGDFLGNGTLLIEDDNRPVEPDEPDRYANWMEWAREELMQHAERIRTMERDKPQQGRTLRHILQHLIGAEREYVRATFGGDKDLNVITKEVEKDEGDPLDQLARLRALEVPRIRAMTADERRYQREAKSGWTSWTARKMFRRMLEHQWEHIQEITARLS